MRAPKRHKPLNRKISISSPANDLFELASKVRYVGSPEHKNTPSFLGQPRPRADASICDKSLAARQEEITGWLRSAIEKGNVSEYWENGFPRYVWHQEGITCYEARLINRVSGEYKGYPLERYECPGDMK
ncbi:MAG: hypothetical protein GY862_05770 [Gammaproteobacteria bacterium]|nr:hypothetical protein [Gammaproteobacteria bacterium]